MPSVDHLEELFEPVGGVSIRRMFGGLGIFKHGLMFGLVIDDALHLKADQQTAPRYRDEGSEPWFYKRKNRGGTETSYWAVPERLLDDHDEFREWADAAFAAALRIAAAKQKPRTKKKPVVKAKAKAKPKPKVKAKPKSAGPKLAKPKPKKKAAPKRR